MRKRPTAGEERLPPTPAPRTLLAGRRFPPDANVCDAQRMMDIGSATNCKMNRSITASNGLPRARSLTRHPSPLRSSAQAGCPLLATRIDPTASAARALVRLRAARTPWGGDLAANTDRACCLERDDRAEAVAEESVGALDEGFARNMARRTSPPGPAATAPPVRCRPQDVHASLETARRPRPHSGSRKASFLHALHGAEP
jgi:hypothetical protein